MPCCGSAGRPPRPGPRTVSTGRPAPRGACSRGALPSPSLGPSWGSLQLGQGRGDPRFGESHGQGSCPGRGEVRRTPLCAPGRERHQCRGSGQGELAPVLGVVVAPGECERSLREGGSGLGEQGWSSRGLRAPPWGPHPQGSCPLVLLAEPSRGPVCPAVLGLPKISVLPQGLGQDGLCLRCTEPGQFAAPSLHRCCPTVWGAHSEACCGAGLSHGRTPCGSPARQGGPAMPGENTAPLGPQGAGTAPSHPVPTCRWQLPAALPAPGTLPALPACACVTWLGMNIAKHSGSAPVRSRCGERHTRPCALSRGGPGRRRGVAQPRSRRLGTGTQEPREQPPSCHPAVPMAAPGWHRRGRGLGQGDAKSATAEEPNRGPVRAGVWSINK